jgi:hypothetical protein
LAALAYAGAGGNLNLAQSFYIKAKGYGMGKYSNDIKNLLTVQEEEVNITGTTFEKTSDNIAKFKIWWKRINTEHFLIFWVMGAFTITLLGFLAFITTYGTKIDLSGINFVVAESVEIGKKIFPLAGTLFLVICAITLFGTQMAVFDATSRIITENIILTGKRRDGKNISKRYYFVLWGQIISGVVIILAGLTEPLKLITIAAILNAFAMFVHIGLTLWLNTTQLEKAVRPTLFRICTMSLAFIFYGGFSIYTVIKSLF